MKYNRSAVKEEYINIEDKLPEKGKDIIGIDSNDDKVYCFRCACSNPNCLEWRSPFGGAIITEIFKWKYDV